jgi:multidrug transporter EmrE-like cation transporter
MQRSGARHRAGVKATLDPPRPLKHYRAVALLKSPAFIIIGSQILFSISDLMGRSFMKSQGFTLASFFTWWFLIYTVIRQVAVFGQLYIYSTMELGRTVALFGAGSIIIGNLIGLLYLKETMSLPVYVGVSLAICAFLALALIPAGAATPPPSP